MTRYKVVVLETLVHEVEVEADDHATARLLAVKNRDEWLTDRDHWVVTGDVFVLPSKESRIDA